MCLGRARICLEWYQGTGIGYPEFLLVHEAYKLRRILVIKERSRRGMVVKACCDPSTLEPEACRIPSPEPGRKELRLLSALGLFFACLH